MRLITSALRLKKALLACLFIETRATGLLLLSRAVLAHLPSRAPLVLGLPSLVTCRGPTLIRSIPFGVHCKNTTRLTGASLPAGEGPPGLPPHEDLCHQCDAARSLCLPIYPHMPPVLP